MKKTIHILIMTALMTAGFSTSSYAGHRSDRGWATAGKVLTGIAGVALLADAIASPVDYYPGHHGYSHHDRHYYRPAYVPEYCPPPVVVVREEYPPRGRWIEGHYVQYEERVWIPGETRKIWVPPTYTWERHHGRNIKVYYEGYYRYEEMPGRYDVCVKERWVEGHWE